jgi:hypothetical protein
MMHRFLKSLLVMGLLLGFAAGCQEKSPQISTDAGGNKPAQDVAPVGGKGKVNAVAQ